MIKLPREKTSFVTPEGILGFPALYPGQAVDSNTPGSKAYKAEWSGDVLPTDPLAQAITFVAQSMDASNWERYVFGTSGRLRKLEEMPKRDPSKYPYAQGKIVVNFSKIVSLKFLNMEGANLADPETRRKYDQGINAQAPGAHKYANPNLPGDLQKIEEKNADLIARGLTPIKEADYFKTIIPVASHEIWPGCYVRISGNAYWTEGTSLGKAVLVNFSNVLLTRTGERLVSEASADRDFGAFAPTSELAPPAPVAAGNWGNLV